MFQRPRYAAAAITNRMHRGSTQLARDGFLVSHFGQLIALLTLANLALAKATCNDQSRSNPPGYSRQRGSRACALLSPSFHFGAGGSNLRSDLAAHCCDVANQRVSEQVTCSRIPSSAELPGRQFRQPSDGTGLRTRGRPSRTRDSAPNRASRILPRRLRKPRRKERKVSPQMGFEPP